jgi:large subunit ribosomal protein L2
VNTLVRKGKEKRFRGDRSPVRRQEGDRDARGRSVHRRDHRALRRGQEHGIEDIQSDIAGPPPAGSVDRSAVEGQAGQELTEGLTKGRSQQHRPHHGPSSRWRSQAHLSHGRLQASQSFDVPATVERLEYDPNRTAFIALIKYEDGEQATSWRRSVWPGDKVSPETKADVKPGNAMPLASHAGRHDRAQCRAEAGKGGTDCTLGRCLCSARRPRPGPMRSFVCSRASSAGFSATCMASVGAVSNPDHMNTNLGKAGRARWLGAVRRFAVWS